MARIRRVSWASDLFGHEVSHGISIPRITWGDYDNIVECIEKEFGRALARVTSQMFEEATAGLGIISKRSHLITVLITSIVETKVHFILSFDDLEVLPAIQHNVLSKIHRQAKLGAGLKVEGEKLIGTIDMSRALNVILASEKFTKADPWPNPGRASPEELAAINSR
jgi:hypothetical protein